MPCPTAVVVNVHNMAQLMADSELAVGAAGSTSWERCCLGLPSLVIVLAENQRASAEAMQTAEAVLLIGGVGDIVMQLPATVHEMLNPKRLGEMALAAGSITDGMGVLKTLRAMEAFHV